MKMPQAHRGPGQADWRVAAGQLRQRTRTRFGRLLGAAQRGSSPLQPRGGQDRGEGSGGARSLLAQPPGQQGAHGQGSSLPRPLLFHL